MEYQCSKEQFLKDVINHEMLVLKDEGVNRHIVFKRPESSTYRFDLITWPWYLCICGDMGTWVFSRTEDMFDFFDMDDNDFNKSNIINPCYWEEKLQSISRFGGPAREFSKELFKKQILEEVKDYYEDGNPEEERECIEDIKSSVLSYVDDVHPQVLYNMLWEYGFGDFRFDEIPNCEEYTFYYIWICYAIVWGIKKYKNEQFEEIK